MPPVPDRASNTAPEPPAARDRTQLVLAPVLFAAGVMTALAFTTRIGPEFIAGMIVVAVLGMILANGLPLPDHPVFNAPGFARASQDGFF